MQHMLVMGSADRVLSVHGLTLLTGHGVERWGTDWIWAIDNGYCLNTGCRDWVSTPFTQSVPHLYCPYQNNTHPYNQCVISTPSVQPMLSEYSQSVYIICPALRPVRIPPL